jgi:hypothetical protein
LKISDEQLDLCLEMLVIRFHEFQRNNFGLAGGRGNRTLETGRIVGTFPPETKSHGEYQKHQCHHQRCLLRKPIATLGTIARARVLEIATTASRAQQTTVPTGAGDATVVTDIATRGFATASIKLCSFVDNGILFPLRAVSRNQSVSYVSLSHGAQSVVPEVLLEPQLPINTIERFKRGGRFRARNIDCKCGIGSSDIMERLDGIAKRLSWIVLILPPPAKYTSSGINIILIFVYGTWGTPRSGYKFPWRTMNAETSASPRTTVSRTGRAISTSVTTGLASVNLEVMDWTINARSLPRFALICTNRAQLT